MTKLSFIPVTLIPSNVVTYCSHQRKIPKTRCASDHSDWAVFGAETARLRCFAYPSYQTKTYRYAHCWRGNGLQAALGVPIAQCSILFALAGASWHQVPIAYAYLSTVPFEMQPQTRLPGGKRNRRGMSEFRGWFNRMRQHDAGDKRCALKPRQHSKRQNGAYAVCRNIKSPCSVLRQKPSDQPVKRPKARSHFCVTNCLHQVTQHID